MGVLFSATAIGALMLGGANVALAEEFPTFQPNGFPITPHQVQVLGAEEVRDRAPRSRLTDGMPASQHQLRALRQDNSRNAMRRPGQRYAVRVPSPQ